MIDEKTLVPILGAIIVGVISIITEFLLIKIRWIDINKIIKNKKKIEKLNKELKEEIEKMKEGKIDQQKIAEKQKEMLSLNFEIMKEKLKVSFVSFIPVILVFKVIYDVEKGFGWWFLTYLIVYFITDKLLRIVAKKMKVEIDA